MNRQQKIVLFHVGFWGVYMLRSYFFWQENFPTLKIVLLNTFFLAMPTYVNYFFLAPRLLLRPAPVVQKIFSGLAWLISYFSVHMSSIHGGLTEFFEPGLTFWNPIKLEWSMIMFVYMGTFSTGSRWLVDWHRNQITNAKLETQMKQNALQNFKTSLNASFLLGTLSNLVEQSRKSPESIQTPLLHLADVLRHAIYVSPYDRIPAKEELHVLHEYVKLQNRYHGKFELRVQQVGNPNLKLPPNLILKVIQEWFELSHEQLKGCIDIELDLKKEQVELQLDLQHWDTEKRTQFSAYVEKIHQLVTGFQYAFSQKKIRCTYTA